MEKEDEKTLFFYRTSLLDLDAFCESAEEKKNVPRGRERERERERERTPR